MTRLQGWSDGLTPSKEKKSDEPRRPMRPKRSLRNTPAPSANDHDMSPSNGSPLSKNAQKRERRSWLGMALLWGIAITVIVAANLYVTWRQAQDEAFIEMENKDGTRFRIYE